MISRVMNEQIVEVLQGNTLANLLDADWVRAHRGGAAPAEGGAFADSVGSRSGPRGDREWSSRG
jgi:hypothetical protein